MKKIISVFTALIAVCTLTACSTETKAPNTSVSSDNTVNNGSQSSGSPSDRENNDKPQDNTASSHILIAYFSVPEDISTADAIAEASIVVKDGVKTGNTEYAAKLIREAVGGDLFRIETVESYPLDHDALIDYAADEQNDGKRPALSPKIENLDRYDTVILGFPNWWADLPMPVYTFLEEYDLSGKTIVPFVTHGGSGFSSTAKTISEMQPDARVSDNTLSLSRNSVSECKAQVTEWAQSLGIS